MKPFTLQWWLFLLQENSRAIGQILEHKVKTDNEQVEEACVKTLVRLTGKADWMRHRINRKYGEQNN